MLEIDERAAFDRWLRDRDRPPAAVQGLDLRDATEAIAAVALRDCAFLGCRLERLAAGHLATTGSVVIPHTDRFQFDVHRAQLYRVDELFDGFRVDDPDGYAKTRDAAIYREYVDQGKAEPSSIGVSLARRLHDHSMTDALHEFIAGRRVVAIMGGHGLERGDPRYAAVARIARALTRQGCLLASGGGPGAMEATHLGAWLSTRDDDALHAALEVLTPRPVGADPGKEYADADWLHRGWRVRTEFPIPAGEERDCASLGIPTWLYGHEPPAPFATAIAKYFANSVREEGLLMIAKQGVIFAPGSAGTIQEIFQDAAQNHYKTAGHASPMVLFGTEYWTHQYSAWPLLQQLSANQPYSKLLSLSDSEEEIVQRIAAFEPPASLELPPLA